MPLMQLLVRVLVGMAVLVLSVALLSVFSVFLLVLVVVASGVVAWLRWQARRQGLDASPQAFMRRAMQKAGATRRAEATPTIEGEFTRVAEEPEQPFR